MRMQTLRHNIRNGVSVHLSVLPGVGENDRFFMITVSNGKLGGVVQYVYRDEELSLAVNDQIVEYIEHRGGSFQLTKNIRREAVRHACDMQEINRCVFAEFSARVKRDKKLASKLSGSELSAYLEAAKEHHNRAREMARAMGFRR